MVGGKDSILTPERVRALDGIGFVWNVSRPCWEERLVELDDYRKIHGHCDVTKSYAGNSKLFHWVATQRKQYTLYLKGRASCITLSRIQDLESLGFESDCSGVTWEDRLSELADFREIHGHCNVTKSYAGNSKLFHWVATQRKQYILHLKGRT
jgi:hypothetical protein